MIVSITNTLKSEILFHNYTAMKKENQLHYLLLTLYYRLILKTCFSFQFVVFQSVL